MSASLDASFLDGIKEDLCKTPVVAIRGELWSEYFALKLNDGGFEETNPHVETTISTENMASSIPALTW